MLYLCSLQVGILLCFLMNIKVAIDYLVVPSYPDFHFKKRYSGSGTQYKNAYLP